MRAWCIQSCPDEPDAQNAVAWILVSMPQSSLNDPATAVRLASRSVELKANDASLWNTLGVAQYRAGNFDQAVAALQKSMQLGRGGSSVDFFFLAMAEQRLGHGKEARQHGERPRGVHRPEVAIRYRAVNHSPGGEIGDLAFVRPQVDCIHQKGRSEHDGGRHATRLEIRLAGDRRCPIAHTP